MSNPLSGSCQFPSAVDGHGAVIGGRGFELNLDGGGQEVAVEVDGQEEEFGGGSDRSSSQLSPLLRQE